MRYAIWYHLYNLKNVKNIHGGVLILVKLQAESKPKTKSSMTLPPDPDLATRLFVESIISVTITFTAFKKN